MCAFIKIKSNEFQIYAAVSYDVDGNGFIFFVENHVVFNITYTKSVKIPIVTLFC